MLVRRWLDAAGITDAALRQCYTFCVRSLAGHGEGVWWALRLAPASLRPYTATLGAHLFAADRYADTGPRAGRARRLDAYAEASMAALASGGAADPVLHALADTVRAFDLPTRVVADVFTGMRRDVAFREFQTYAEFGEWASVMSGGPLLGHALVMAPAPDVRHAEPVLRELGELFQLTDALCDLAEDLRDGRLYLPLEDLDRFGVRADDLLAGRWTPATADLLAFECRRVSGRVPVLVDSVGHRDAAGYLRPMGDYCALRVSAVLAAGPAVLHRPVQVRNTDLLDLWRRPWRAAIPC